MYRYIEESIASDEARYTAFQEQDNALASTLAFGFTNASESESAPGPTAQIVPSPWSHPGSMAGLSQPSHPPTGPQASIQTPHSISRRMSMQSMVHGFVAAAAQTRRSDEF
jgi:hypothetical protein